MTARLNKLRSQPLWELQPEPSSFAPNNKWSNKDMDPVPIHQRSWTMWDYTSYWLSDGFNVATWNMASSMLAVGLSWKQALPAIAIGHFLIALAVTANGTIGARLHIPFPVLNRSSFGYWLSYFSVVSRCVLAMFWFGVQCVTGGQCVYQCLKAIWPSIARIPNGLSDSANITTVEMMCYFLYWLIQFPFLLVSPHKIRYLFIAKAILAPATGLAIMIWAFVRSGGGPIFAQKATISGPALSWAMLSAMNSAIGNYATLSVNIPDFTRYARSPRDQYIQVLIIPVIFTFFAFMGIAATSAGNVIYGEILWNPLTLIDRWDNRAAAFFASFSFCLATIGTNVSANSISAANDFTALLPKWLNIKRGQILCAFIGGWVVCPWEILGSAIGFLNFMGGYTVFLGPICSIMIVDYWFVHKGKIDVPALYDPKGRYRYTGGVNWRALLALCVSVPPNLPGLIHSINPKIDVGLGGQHLFSIAWLLGFSLAGVTYYVTSMLFPPRETMIEELITGDDQIPQPNGSENITDEKSSDVKVNTQAV
ncbi:putative permease C1683,05 OS=Schizosaccharomyces pombe (strain 972 / ATCC 24843) GN=SPBC1683.05 PE=3 SV=1 [Rhizoctonia solani AG-1 IB]|uniref:Putative permease C1683,05 n=1 Tax=Thanatephorus cucumeris (strain AG1-IB / isolate 7/3/14) TaxID=1108050 RepID=A0A0B7F7F4_THACB|nr:putative permease C1683,05 OS=Schizosaccharomyces pombe (strain 972 / ATCC 24843) GN=SPBC1683.05 PE=3 SV=1 [Rhizoctonia solani AG-1 IB]